MSGDPLTSSLSEVEVWLERRWMGRLLPTLVDRGFTSIAQIQSASEHDVQQIISLFDKPGHRLKIRILLQELRSAPPGSLGGPLNPIATESDDEDDDDDDDSDDSDEDGNSQSKQAASANAAAGSSPPPAMAAPDDRQRQIFHEQQMAAQMLAQQQAELQRQQAALAEQQRALIEAQQAQEAAARQLAEKTETESRDLAEQQRLAQQALIARQLEEESRLKQQLEAQALAQVQQQAIAAQQAQAGQAALSAQKSPPPINGVPPVPDDSDSDSDAEGGGSASPLSPRTASSLNPNSNDPIQQLAAQQHQLAMVQAKQRELEMQRHQQDQFNLQQALLLQKQQDEIERQQMKTQQPQSISPSQPPPSSSTASSPSQPSPPSSEPKLPTSSSNVGAPPVVKQVNSNLAARMAGLNMQPPQSAPAAGRPSAQNVGSLKDRMAKLQEANASSPAGGPGGAGGAGPSAESDDERNRKAAFKAKFANVGAINIFSPGAAPPAYLAAKLAAPNERTFRDDSEDMGSHIPQEDYEYELPPVANLADPQKSGYLEKRATQDVWKNRWCILKDDCFFWLNDPADPNPTGVIVLSEPGLSMTLSTDTVLEITSRRKTYQFRTQTPEEMTGWNSKLRVAKLLFTSGTAQSFARKVKLSEEKIAARQVLLEEQSRLAAQQRAMAMGANPTSPMAGGYHGAQPGVSPYGMPNGPGGGPYGNQSPHDPKMEAKQREKEFREAEAAIQAATAQAAALVKQPEGKDVLSHNITQRRDSLKVQKNTPDPRALQDMVTNGAIFTKYKRKRGKRRLIWCPQGLDRIFWGDEKRKIKGFMMAADIRGVSEGCPGAKKDQNSFTIISKERTLELEAPDVETKNMWMQGVQMLIRFAAQQQQQQK